MADDPARERAVVLMHNAQLAFREADSARALELARQALALNPESSQAKELLTAISAGNSSTSADLVSFVARYVDSQQASDAKNAITHIKRLSKIDDEQARQCIDKLLRRDSSRVSTALDDDLTAILLDQSVAAQNSIFERFDKQPTETFRTCWHKGAKTYTRLIASIVENVPSRPEHVRCKAIAGAFQLALAHVIDAGEDHVDRALDTVSRLLGNHSDCCTGLLDYDVFEILLPRLDIRESATIRTQATFAIITLLKISTEAGSKHVQAFLIDRVNKERQEDLIVAFSTAAAVFPISPATISEMLLVQDFIPSLMPSLRRNSNSLGDHKSQTLELAALGLFGAACVDKSCREAIAKHAAGWLRTVADSTNETNAAAAALVLTKFGHEAEQAASSGADALDLARKFVRALVDRSTISIEVQKSAIEGLAYGSLKPVVKDTLVEDTKALGRLSALLGETSIDKSSVFGVLTILKNITDYPPIQSDEQKKMSELRAYADADNKQEQAEPESDEKVRTRCMAVLQSGLVAVLVQKRLDESPAALVLIVQIMNSLAREQKHRGQLAQQGVVRAMVYVQTKGGMTSNSQKDQIDRIATHALARILISVNPNHVFTASNPAISALQPLLSLITPNDTEADANLLPTFEALLALTNLASIHEQGIREVIIRTSWPQLEELMLHANAMIQRAAVELVCNLMTSPECVAKFADGSKQSQSRLGILLALTDAKDLATRKAAGGALAMLTEWDAAVQAIMNGEKSIKMVLGMCDDDSDEMKHRGIVCLTNIISVPGSAATRGLEAVRAAGGAHSVRNAIQKANVSEVRQLGLALLKKLG